MTATGASIHGRTWSGIDTRNRIITSPTPSSVPPKIGDEAASFLMMNRNKRGIALDLKKPGGKRVLERLVPRVDVLIENFSPGTMEKLGFGYAQLKTINPALIYCTLTGFGRTGSRANASPDEGPMPVASSGTATQTSPPNCAPRSVGTTTW